MRRTDGASITFLDDMSIGSSGGAKTCMEWLETRRLLAAGDLDLTYGIGGHASAPAAAYPVEIAQLGADRFAAVLEDGSVERLTSGGAVDTSFGSAGRVAGALGDSEMRGRGITTMPDGRIIIVGSKGDFSDDGSFKSTSTIVRLRASGTRDTTFGTNGAVTVSDEYKDPTVLPDGSIVVTRIRRPTTTDAYELVRFTSKGKLDPIFGGDGVAADHPTVPFRSINRVLVQPDGKILVGGRVFARFGNATRSAFAVGRLNADGTWDTSFGDFGRALTPIGASNDSEINDLALSADGKILAVGNTELPSHEKVFAAVRYNSDGSVDTTYGDAGVATVGFINERTLYSSPQVSSACRVFLDEQGGAVLAGALDQTFALARLDAAGKIDPLLGRVTDLRDALPQTALQSGGRIVFAGAASTRKGAHSIVTSAFDLTSTAPPSPVALADKTLSLAGTSGADVVFIKSDSNNILARINGFGRIFSKTDVTLAFMSLGAGNDVVDATTSSAPITVSAGDGDDRMVGGDADDSLSGGAGKDRMEGGKGNDRLAGNGGRDKIAGGEGNDRIFGGASGDFLAGEGGHDEIFGEGGNDRINGSVGADSVHGGAGDDFFLNGRDGDKETLFGDAGNDWVVDKGEIDELVSMEKVTSS